MRAYLPKSQGVFSVFYRFFLIIIRLCGFILLLLMIEFTYLFIHLSISICFEFYILPVRLVGWLVG